jgi:hypothetical protein
MPERQTLQRARCDKRQGKATTTQAGEFIREEMHHIREGVHGARSARQAIAIGLSKARRAGVELKPPAPDQTSTKARRSAERDYERGHGAPSAHQPNPRRSRISPNALKREGSAAASPRAIGLQTREAASRRNRSERSSAARHAATTRRRNARGSSHASE